MPFNHLEQMVSEWLEYQGYFVRRNVRVGKRDQGGYECELDIVAIHPKRKTLVQYEPSTDTDSWEKREARYRKKFEAGQKYIPGLFDGFEIPGKIEQYAVFLYGSDSNHKELAGGMVLMVDDILKKMVEVLSMKRIANEIVPEQLPLLRMIQLTCEYRRTLFNSPQ